MLLVCAFFLFPSLLFADDTNTGGDNISHDGAIIKTIVNIPHYKEVNIVHKINERLLATYSKHDKKLKIWDRSKFLLIAEYDPTEGEVNQLFSIGGQLFAKSQSAFYRIDLARDSIEKILSDVSLSSITIINNRFIVFIDNRARYRARIISYDYLSGKLKSMPYDMNVCGACSLDKIFFSNNKYYVPVNFDGVSFQVYDKDFNLIEIYTTWFKEKYKTMNVKVYSKFNINSIKKIPNIVPISENAEGISNTLKTKLVESKIKLKSKIKNYIKIEESNYSIKNERTGNVAGFPLRKFYLFNKQSGKSKLITAGNEEYAASNVTKFTEEFIDIQNEVVGIRCHSYGTESFFIFDFSGDLLGESQQFDLDEIDIVPIENYLLLINYTKGNIISYDLKKQSRVVKYRKENIEGQKISMMIGAAYQSDSPKLKKSHIFNDVFDIVDINISGVLLTTILANNCIKTWNLSTGKLLATKYTINESTDVIVTPEGYFTGKGSYQDYVHFVDNRFNVYYFTQFARRFYRPEIVQLSLSGKSPSDVESIESVIANQKAPSIKIISPDNNYRTSNDTATVKVKILDGGGGIGDVYLYLNDVLVSIYTKGIKIVPSEKSKLFSFKISLSEGKNKIKVIAYNKANSMSSEPDNIVLISNYKFDAPSLYILAVGIDTYENNELNLRYAVADLELFTKNIEQLSAPLFKNVNIISLSSPHDTTKEALSRAFNRLSLDVRAGDYFIFYNSSHGYIASFNNGDSKFFLITSDVIFLDPENLKKYAISQDELVSLIGNIPAQNKIMILDTCHSGEAGRIIQMAAMSGKQKTYTRALSSATAMQLLKMASGSSVFTASQSVEAAIEGFKGHGLFTYTLVEGMKGMADENNDKFITLGELKSYVERNVFIRSKEQFKIKQVPYVNIGTIDFSIANVR